MNSNLNNNCSHGNLRTNKKITVFRINLTLFCTDGEASSFQNTELHPRCAAPSDLRHSGLKQFLKSCPTNYVNTIRAFKCLLFISL